MEFKKHLFLTGKKQVGKTTLLNKLLANSSKEKAGFVTKRILHDDGFYYVHIMKPKGSPTNDNLLFKCYKKSSDSTSLFEKLGCDALDCKGEIILMDELGPHEEMALRFQEKVLTLLDGDIPVAGVIQEAKSAFLDKLLHHPNVTVITVTEENRDQLYDTLKKWHGW